MSAKLLRQTDLLVLVLVAVICVAVSLAVPDHAVRAVVVVPLCLICPGYALTAALFARNRLELPARIMLSLALSLSILVLGGIVLNSLGGIERTSWVILLLVVILAAAGLAVRGRVETDTGPLNVAWRPTPKQVVNGLVLCIVLLVAVGAMTASRIPLGAPNSNGYETLSLTQSGPSTLHLTVSSARQHRAAYRLSIYVDRRLVRNERLTLGPGDASDVTLALARAKVARSVQASVVKLGGAWTPRRVRLTLPAA